LFGEDTFSSSLRFSLRFFLRRAISARRMACSSAVRCFFVCGSECEELVMLVGELVAMSRQADVLDRHVESYRDRNTNPSVTVGNPRP